jgi:hypothetical protein
MRQSFHRSEPEANADSPHATDYLHAAAYIGCTLAPKHPQSLLMFGLIMAAMLGCATDTITLNSERIARKFGSYGLEVIENKDNIRVSNLYSREATGRVCRTFAVVGISKEIDSSLAAEHKEILEGGSIGAVFQRNGWKIHKRHQYIGEMTIGKQAGRLIRLMRLKPPATLAVHIYMLSVSKNDRPFDYAVITEVHHPDYLTVSTLWAIYGNEYAGGWDRKDARPILELVRAKFREAAHSY